MNGFAPEEVTQRGADPAAAAPGAGQLCCLREEGERCGRAAGNASFSKRIQKSISQKKVKIELDKSLQVNTLRRYKRHFKLQTRPGLNKAQLVEIIGCHFRTIPVNEKDTLTYFIYSVKNDKNKTDLKTDSGVH
ncbi:histone deacetylase complex subunit SAP30 isoform X4 [Indicator indicator]|uniref:histone deacetylase complex subunit SAP30 isoform X4 n=1 Tax=Indicator indicator TaxID=1002788 RepID=UPI0023DF3BCB|nr:histone deacetylase complex subunit SAP30 isoform X4 [Indicator indicator]